MLLSNAKSAPYGSSLLSFVPLSAYSFGALEGRNHCTLLPLKRRYGNLLSDPGVKIFS